MEYYSAIKGNELSSHGKTRRNLKCMLLSERSQSEKVTYCMIPTFWKKQNYGNKKNIKWLPGAGVEREG